MAVTSFNNISDLKRQPTVKRSSGLGGLPQPMQAQMKQGPKIQRLKVKYPKAAK